MALPSYTQLTSLAAAKSFARTGADVDVPEGALAVHLQAESQNVRFRCDGTAPTASVGSLLIAGDAPIKITGQAQMLGLKVIEVAASAKLNIEFVAS